MRRKVSLLTISTVAACALLAGCASLGLKGNAKIWHQTHQSVAKALHRGTTTEADVRRLYGDPNSTKFLSNGDTQWTYEATEGAEMGGMGYSPTGNPAKILTLEFNKQKVLKDYSFSKTTTSHKIP